MPELPEVETTRRGLAPHLVGRRIEAVTLRRDTLRWPIPPEVSARLVGEQIAAIVSATGFVGIVLTLVLWTTTVPRETVVEHLIGPDVVAGPANDLVPTGATVRELEPRRAADTL